MEGERLPRGRQLGITEVDYSSDGEPVYFVRDTPAGSTLDTLKLQCLDVAGKAVPPGTAGRAWIAARDSAAVQHTWSELPDCVFDDSGCALPNLKVSEEEGTENDIFIKCTVAGKYLCAKLIVQTVPAHYLTGRAQPTLCTTDAGEGVHCNTSAELRTPRQVAQPLSKLMHAQRPQLRCPEKRAAPATPPREDLLLPLQKKLRMQPPETPLQREPELELPCASQADSEAEEVIPDSADEASVLQDTEEEVSSQHDPHPLTASQAEDEGGWAEQHGSLPHKLMSQTDVSTLQQQNTALQAANSALEASTRAAHAELDVADMQMAHLQNQLQAKHGIIAARDQRHDADSAKIESLQDQLEAKQGIITARDQRHTDDTAIIKSLAEQVRASGDILAAASEKAGNLQRQLEQEQLQQETGRAALKLAQDGKRAAEERATDMQHQWQQTQGQLQAEKAALQAAHGSRRGAEERAGLLQMQLGEAQLQQDASREGLQVIQDGQQAAEEMAAVLQHQLAKAQREQESDRAALRAAQAGQQVAKDQATELKHRNKQLQRLVAHLLRQLDDSKAALQAAQNSKRAAEEKATDLQRQLGKAQRQQEADKEALQAAQERLLGQHAAKERAAHAQHQMEEARRLLPTAYCLCSMWQMGHKAGRKALEGASCAAEEKVADLQRQLDKVQRQLNIAQRAQSKSAGVQAELVGLREQLQQTRDALAKAQDLMRTGQNACLIIRAQRYTFEARLSRCEQAFLAQGGLILFGPGEQPNPGERPQDPSVEPIYQILDYGQVEGHTLSLQDFFLSLPEAGREAAALQAAAQQLAQAAPQLQPAVAPSRGLDIAAAETLTAMRMNAA